MKTFLQTLLGVAMLCAAITSNAQTAETFSSFATGNADGQKGWKTSSNVKVIDYNRPGSCSVTNRGLQTPGVGKNANVGLLMPVTSFNSSQNDVVVTFSVYVFDANMNCGIFKPFGCPTFVNAYVVPANWSDALGTPTAAQYYAASPNFEIKSPNSSNTIVFKDLSLPAGVTSYRVLLNFKTADGSNCTTTNTKFIFDDFGINSWDCNNCAPTANADYFNADQQSLFTSSTSFKANLYGNYLMWANEAPTGYETASMENAPAANNGRDYDLNNTSLSNATFTKVQDLTIEKSLGCAANPSAGTLLFNSNGTFTYTKGSACVQRVSFTYTLTTKQSATQIYGTTAATKVTIDMPGQIVGLPVRFMSFTAARNGKQVVLQWATAMEQNNKGFYIQRSTGGEWKDIGLVFSQNEDGNSTSQIDYSFKDLNPVKGITQYRILQVDFDGKGHYSETRAVRGEESSSKLTLFPNPSSNGTVNLLFDANGSKEVTVLDASGQVIKQYKNITGTSLQLKSLQNGLYTVVVRDFAASTTNIEKLLVKKG